MPPYNFLIVDTPADEAAAIQQVKAGNGGTTGEDINYLIFQIPNAEVEANPLINSTDNNLGTKKLTPVN